MEPKTVGGIAAPTITLTGLGISHLLASILNPAGSPVFLVGDQIILLTPTPVKTWAVETMGTWDKPVLLGSILLVTLGLAFLAGRQIWRDPWGKFSVLITIASIPLFLALFLLPITFTSLAPSLLLIALTILQIKLWARFVPEAERHGLDVALGEKDAADPSRRTVLKMASVTGLIGVAAGIAGAGISKARLAIDSIRLPSPKTSLSAKVSHFDDTKGISPLITPVEDFYRVDINLSVPLVDHNEWKLQIKREGYDTVSYTYNDLLAMEAVERDITLVCVSNTVGGKYVGSGRWLGVDLMTLLAPFDPDDGAVDQLFATSTDGYTSSSPLKYVTDGREGMIAFGYNGETLTREHGFPARLLIPGLYGFVGATKWLSSLELTTYDKKEAYWTKRDWATDAPIRPMTRVDYPRALTEVSSDTVVAGVAWAGTLGVSKVEVSIDGGAWTEAEIDVPEGPTEDWDYWVQWRLPVTLEPGNRSVSARCTTKTGVVQEAVRREPFPSGASGWQSLNFVVR